MYLLRLTRQACFHYAASLDGSPGDSSEQVLIFGQYLKWYHILAVVLFLWASHHQYRCHVILANLRKPNSKEPSPSNSSTSDEKSFKHNRQSSTLKQVLEEEEDKEERLVSPKYAMPVGDWFYYVSCPHLFAEILIYLSLLVCQVISEPGSCWWLVVAHVTGSLYLSARQMHRWYLDKFEDYPRNRKSLFPGLC